MTGFQMAVIRILMHIAWMVTIQTGMLSVQQNNDTIISNLTMQSFNLLRDYVKKNAGLEV